MGVPCETSRPELSENVVLFIYIVCDVLENILLNGSVEKKDMLSIIIFNIIIIIIFFL